MRNRTIFATSRSSAASMNRRALSLMMGPEPRGWLKVSPLLLVLLITGLIGSAHTAEAQTASEQTVQARKSPWLAFGMSSLITGAGQAYNGQWGKGGLMLGGQIVSVSLFLSGANDCDIYSPIFDEILGVASDASNYAGCGKVAAGLIGMLGFALWSMIDAPRTANAINRRIDAGQVALEIGPQLIVRNRDSRIDLSLVRVRF